MATSYEVAEALELVSGELAATLNGARSALEQYVEQEGGPQLLERCAGFLHEARGVLQITEAYGASLLAEEMEQTCRHLARHHQLDGPARDAIEALTRAIVQLPAYVERILLGGRDIPLVLLPLLNDLRVARGRPLLTESTLLLLNVGPADYPAAATSREPSGENIAVLCRQLRPRFQLALLNWIRGDDAARAVAELASVIGRLAAAARVPAVHELWRIVGALLEALAQQGLDATVSVKRLVGQADREMRRLTTLGEERYAEQVPTDLVNNLLFYVARSSASGPEAEAVRAAYHLAELMPPDEQVEAARRGMSAPSVTLMQTVAGAIREDLGRVKDVLDIYVRTGMEHVEELAPQVELLKKIGDTLGVLGLGELREQVQAQRHQLEALVAGEPLESDSALVQMAAALLGIEDRLEQQLIGLISTSSVAEPATAPSDEDNDYQRVQQAAMRECLANLARVKEAISLVIERAGDGAALDAVPDLLRSVRAALSFMERLRAAEVAEELGRAIGNVVQQGYGVADARALDRLADAVVSLEYYIETLQAGRREPAYMLDNASRALEALKAEATASAAPVAPARTPAPAPATPAPASRPAMALAPGEVDPEILELFIEEAREAIATIDESLPAWERDEHDAGALQTVRRALHTLKGSGRMVGAEAIGEYCWCLEQLVNRVMDGSVPRTPALLAYLHRAIPVVAELLEQLEVGTPPASDIAALVGQAEALARGELPEAGLEPAAPEPAPAPAPAPAVIDPVLLDILSREVDEHCMAIGEFVAGASPGAQLTDDVYRACHTLHGSLNMAGVTEAVSVAAPLDALAQAMYENRLPVTAGLLDMFRDSTAAIRDMLAALHRGERPAVADEGLVGRLLLLAEAAADQAPVEPVAALDEPLPEFAEVPEPAAAEPAVPEPAARPELPGVVPAAPLGFDPEIAAIFAEEAAELLDIADACVGRLDEPAGRAQALAELQRSLHTLKGGARMSGVYGMGDLSHELETVLIRLDEGWLPATGGLFELIQAAIDELHRLRERIAGGQAEQPAAGLMVALAAALRGELAAASAAAPAIEPTEPMPTTSPPAEAVEAPQVEAAKPAEAGLGGEEVPEAIAAADAAAPRPAVLPALERLGELARELEAPAKVEAPGELAASAASAGPARPVREPRDFARVEAGLLEQLLNAAGEISIANSRLSQQLTQIQFNLDELGQTVVRLREQLRKLEGETEAQILGRHGQDFAGETPDFDPLELDRYSSIQQLSRGLAETASDVNSLRDLLDNLVGDSEALLTQQVRTTNELQDGLMRTRMVPFHQHAARLSRIVRQAASEAGKQAELSVEGSGELDRQVLERMLPAFEHMLRNAVVHGIEAPPERAAAGKPAGGLIRIQLGREGAEVIVEVEDDGRGLDVTAIRRKAVDLGLLGSDEQVTDEEAMQLILRPGFSTADHLTQTAGRGVGMDVVASQVAGLGGTLSIASRPGLGTKFTIRLPFTLAVTQALIVRAGQELFALPLPTVEGIIRIPRRELIERLAEPEPAIEYGGQQYHFRHLGQYLGLGQARIPEQHDRVSIILVKAGENSAALITDEMVDSREIVVKTVGPQLATIRGIAGATILGDGRIVVILDVGALVRAARPIPIVEAPVVADEKRQPAALVVDDSITMRRVTQRLLERNGFRVHTAKDGVEAIAVLQEHRPDIIVLDVEMPRMDGYEFARHVRNDPGNAAIPIIMVTSRVSEKHRARAIEVGVNDYLGKPYHERDLMDAINQLLVPA